MFCLYCDTLSCRCSCVGSMSVSSCICCKFVSCVHPVAVVSAAFCMTCRSRMKEATIGKRHTPEPV